MDKMVKKAADVAEKIFDFPQIDSDLEVWFTFEGREYELAQFNISFGQGVDFKGQPQDEIRGGRIMLTLTQTVPEEIYRWAMTSCTRNGRVEFRSKTTNAPLKIEFTEGYCVNFERKINEGSGLRTILYISPQKVVINDIDMNNHWA